MRWREKDRERCGKKKGRKEGQVWGGGGDLCRFSCPSTTLPRTYRRSKSRCCHFPPLFVLRCHVQGAERAFSPNWNFGFSPHLPVRDRQKFGFSQTWKWCGCVQRNHSHVRPTSIVSDFRFLGEYRWNPSISSREFSEQKSTINRPFGPSVSLPKGPELSVIFISWEANKV